MTRGRRYIIASLSAVAIFLLCAVVYSIADDHHEHKWHEKNGSKKHHDKKNHDNESNEQFVSNISYSESCGGCHWAYVPALLPSKAWENILANLNNHFGNNIVLTSQQLNDISTYLSSNSAEKTSTKIGRKITHNLGGFSPERIIDIPYIHNKHRKISQSIISRKSIGSISNCIACHPAASNAIFDDDDIKIPAE